jgi:hypothetical protein
MYGTTSTQEPERIKPLVDQAEDLYVELGRHREAIQIIAGQNSPLAHALHRAQAFIRDVVDGKNLKAKATR